MVNAFVETSSASETPTFQGEQLVNFLHEHEEIETIVPVLLGLFITSRLQLRGANALLVNLGVASVLRQVFRQLKNPASPTVHTAPSSSAGAFLGEDVTILHSVPGRLRLRIEQLREDALFAKRLQRLLEQEDCVLEIHVNRTAASLVIYYDGGDLSEMALGLKLLQVLTEARREVSPTEVTVPRDTNGVTAD